MEAKDFEFSLGHIGINNPTDEEGKRVARVLSSLFGFGERETSGAVFVNEQFEVMKLPFRGTHGHFSIVTNDLPGAKRYLEERGVVFDEASAMFAEDGSVRVIYARDELAGFAWHLAQRS